MSKFKILLLTIFFIVFHNHLSQAQCWKSISGGRNHSAGIQEDGSLWAWGQNFYGQLGDGTINSKLTPTKIGNETNWQKVYCGAESTFALKTDGTLWAWGDNTNGHLGINTSLDSSIPNQVGSANNWVDFVVGNSFIIAKNSDGTLWSWGLNTGGQLGNGTTIDNASPALISTDTDWEFMGAGGIHVMATRNQGGLYTWGYNVSGQLGIGNNVLQNLPTYVSTNMWYDFDGGLGHSIALILSGAQETTLWTWGANANGQLGDGTTSEKTIPTQIGPPDTWTQVACNIASSYALKSNGSLWTWGRNDYGQLADGTTNDWPIPQHIGFLDNWKNIYGSKGYHALGIKTDGSLWAWGRNDYGQLGDGTSGNVYIIPKLIMACNPSGIEGNSSNLFSIYPNPVRDVLNIQKNNGVNVDEIYITDMNGKRIGNSYSNLEKINVQHLASGVYILNILSQNQISHIKFIKE